MSWIVVVLMPNPGIDAVVTNYRTPDDLDEFCESFYLSELTVPATLVIGNVMPRDADLKVTAKWPKATSLTFETNVGYAHSTNLGVMDGQNDVIAIFNADVILRRDTMQECYNALMNNHNWGVVGPLQYDEQGRVTHAAILGSNSKPVHTDWHLPVGPQHRVTRSVVTVSGAACFTRRETWNDLTTCSLYQEVAPGAIGAYLPTKLFYEDTFYSYHARAHGWEVLAVGGSAECIHKWHRAVNANSAFTYSNQCFHESRELFRRACNHHDIDHD